MKVDPASFRDPEGFVFAHQGRVFRAVRPAAFAALREVLEGPLGKALSGRLVKTQAVAQSAPVHAALKKAFPGKLRFLEHERVPVITYPYEWTAGMLKDAALLTLDIQRELVRRGYTLKDASAYNIQFVRGRPVLIDALSIERNARPAVWTAYGQFCRHFIFPLLLKSHQGLDLKGYFLANRDGLGAPEVFAMTGWRKRLSPAFLVDVSLQKLAHAVAFHGGIGRKERSGKFWRESADSGAQEMNLDRLSAKVQGLSFPAPSGPWADYYRRKGEEHAGEREKRAFVEKFLAERTPRTVLDLGCNTGRYAFLAAAAGADVVAVDADHGCAEAVYARSRREDVSVLPLWMDLANPSPGIGLAGRERPRFAERVRGDAVLALSVAHHLLSAARISPPALCGMLAELTERHLLLEHVPWDDAEYRALAAGPVSPDPAVGLDGLIRTFSKRFRLTRRRRIPGSRRSLLAFVKR